MIRGHRENWIKSTCTSFGKECITHVISLVIDLYKSSPFILIILGAYYKDLINLINFSPHFHSSVKFADARRYVLSAIPFKKVVGECLCLTFWTAPW